MDSLDSTARLPHSHISLKEWNTLLAVVRNDGFARAAEILHISQPAISYTIAKIEARLGISILRPDGRRARITPVGQQLLAHVEPLLQLAVQVETIARELRASWRPDVGLAVVDDFPTGLLLPLLHSHAESDAGAIVHLTEGPDEAVQQMLNKREAELAILRRLGPGMQGEVLFESGYVAVAHPQHVLCRLTRPIGDADLRQAVEIAVGTACAAPARAADHRQAPPRRWLVASADTAEQALAQGLGYGWLPAYRAEPALAAGRLARLPLGGYPHRVERFYLAHLDARPPGDDARRLASALQTALAARPMP